MKNKTLIEKIEIMENVDLKSYNTFKIGGTARYMAFPKNSDGIEKVINYCSKKKLKYYVLGNGSNILFDDGVYDGIIINTCKLNKITCKKVQDDYIVKAGAGVRLYSLHKFLAENELGGFEWCFGIPASVGGFVVMNGGCFGHDVFEFLYEVEVFYDNRIFTIKKEDLKFGYRTSNLENYVITSAKFNFTSEKKEIIEEKQRFYFNLKKEKQPLEHYNAGSIFKNTSNEIVAKLIDDAGLKGYQCGDAEVSIKHANFIINKGKATCNDVLDLIDLIQKILNRNLDLEIKVIKF